MKTLLFALVCIGCLVGCKEGDTKPEVRLFNHYFIFHKDTLIVEGTNKFDVQKLGVSESWNMIDSNNWYHYFEIKYGNKLYSLPLEDTSEVLQTDGAGVHGWVSVKEATYPKPEVIPQWRDACKATIDTLPTTSSSPAPMTIDASKLKFQPMPYIYEDTIKIGDND